jgi:hypothetical protein
MLDTKRGEIRAPKRAGEADHSHVRRFKQQAWIFFACSASCSA